MQWLKRQQKILGAGILSALFAVAVLSVVSMCCGFGSHVTHQASNHNQSQHTAQHHVILCADSLPSQNPCHSEKTQQVAVLPQTRSEEIDEKNNQTPDTTDSFMIAFKVYIPPEQERSPSYFSDVPRIQNNKLLITQLPRAHLG